MLGAVRFAYMLQRVVKTGYEWTTPEGEKRDKTKEVKTIKAVIIAAVIAVIAFSTIANIIMDIASFIEFLTV